MATKVTMPQLGESVVEGTVTKWLKQEGERINEFDPLLEVNTDKVDTEVPAPATGTVLRLYVGEGATVQAGTLLAVIGQPGEAIPEDGEPVAAHAGHSPAPAKASTPAVSTRELGFVSPVVARVAAEHGVNLQQVEGTGSGGRITKKDVLAFVEGKGAAAAPRPEPVPELAPWETPGDGDLFRPTELQFGTTLGASRPAVPTPEAPTARVQAPATGAALPGTSVPLTTIRKSIAEHMVRSRRTSPHVTSVMEADMSAVAAHREANKAAFTQDGANLTFTAYMVVAAVVALRAYPMVNSSWGEDKIVLHKPIHIGVAVSLGEEGLIVPVIKNVEEKSLLKIARELNDLASRARAHQLRPDDVAGGTFTITNHGSSGSLFAAPIINQPQAAILGVGVIEKRVRVINDAIAIRPMVYLSMTIDHRILDGAIADYFLAKVKETLESWA